MMAISILVYAGNRIHICHPCCELNTVVLGRLMRDSELQTMTS
jgi:hypothetical protein